MAIGRASARHVPQTQLTLAHGIGAGQGDLEAAKTGVAAAQPACKTELAVEHFGQTQMEKSRSWPLLLTTHRGADEAPATLPGR